MNRTQSEYRKFMLDKELKIRNEIDLHCVVSTEHSLTLLLSMWLVKTSQICCFHYAIRFHVVQLLEIEILSVYSAAYLFSHCAHSCWIHYNVLESFDDVWISSINSLPINPFSFKKQTFFLTIRRILWFQMHQKFNFGFGTFYLFIIFSTSLLAKC